MEKDKLVAEQSNVITEQRKQIQMLMDLFNRNEKNVVLLDLRVPLRKA